MDLTPKQQTSEAIRQAETILITAGQHPSVDQVAAVIGLAAILRKFGKKVSAVVSDSLPQSLQLLDTSGLERSMSGMRDFVLNVDVTKAEVDKLRYEVADGKLQIFITPFKGGFAPSDVTFDYGSFHYDLAIVLGVPTRTRIDRVYEQNLATFESIPIVNLDFHRSNENYGAVNLIEPNASSLCEMLVALSESLQGGIIDGDIATALLMGIVASTDRFTASHTTSKSLTVAAQMMAAGARHQAVTRALYREGRGDRSGNDQSRGDRSDRGQREQARSSAQPASGVTTSQQQQPVRSAAQPAPMSGGQSETVSQTRPEYAPPRGREQELPIIDPGHIEITQDDSAATPETPTPETASIAPVVPAPPMADFAAAAEVLTQRQPQEPAAGTDQPVQ